VMSVSLTLNIGAIEALADPTEELKTATRRVEEAAKRYAPVDTGELRSSISSSVSGRGMNARGRVTAAAAHAAHVEWGTSRSPAQPYLRPAIRSVGGA